MIYYVSYYIILPLMMVVVPSLMLACMLCRGCEERRKQAVADERQMRVARELVQFDRHKVKQWPYDEHHTLEDLAYFERLYNGTGVVLIKQRRVT